MKPFAFFILMTTILCSYGQNIPQPQQCDSIQFVSLFRADMGDSVVCYRIPALVTAPNGDLIAAIDERVESCGDLRSNRNINIVIRRSSDLGKSWSPMETVVDYPWGQSASDPSMIVDKVTNEIFLFFNFMDLTSEKEKNVYYLRVVKSRDNGKTWSLPVDITEQITRPEWRRDFKFITSGGGCQTHSGKLLNTLVDLERGLFVFASDNHGKSWHLIDTPVSPADESKIVELTNRTWMINSRVNGPGIRFIHTSADKGKTWSSMPDSSLVDPGCNAGFIRYTAVEAGDDKNRLLFSNANMKGDRMNLTVRVSYDEGRTWPEGKTVYAGRAAYSSLCVLPNGDIGLFFEKDEYEDNAFIRFSLEWLTDGHDKYRKTP